MESFDKRVGIFYRALATLKEAEAERKPLSEEDKYYRATSDSLIQRFEYTIDIFWKVLKEYLVITLQISPGNSPRSVINAAYENDILNDKEYKAFIQMIEARNITSHAYDLAVAQEICLSIPEYIKLMDSVALKLLKQR